MENSKKDFNYDRIISAEAQINMARIDMVRVLHTGHLSRNTQERIVLMLRNAAEDIEKMEVT